LVSAKFGLSDFLLPDLDEPIDGRHVLADEHLLFVGGPDLLDLFGVDPQEDIV